MLIYGVGGEMLNFFFVQQGCNDVFFPSFNLEEKTSNPHETRLRLALDLLCAPRFEPQGPWPGWPTGKWTRQGDAASVGAGSGSGPVPPSVPNAAVWFLRRKTGIKGGAWRAQPQTAWCWVKGRGRSIRQALGLPCPEPQHRDQKKRLVWRAGEAVPAGGRKDAHACQAPCLRPRVASGGRELAAHPFCLREKSRVLEGGVFSLLTWGCSPDTQTSRENHALGASPLSLPGRASAGLLWAAHSCPGVLLCFLVDGGWWGRQNPGERAGAPKDMPSAHLREGPGRSGGPCVHPAPCGPGQIQVALWTGGVSRALGQKPYLLGVWREIWNKGESLPERGP